MQKMDYIYNNMNWTCHCLYFTTQQGYQLNLESQHTVTLRLRMHFDFWLKMENPLTAENHFAEVGNWAGWQSVMHRAF